MQTFFSQFGPVEKIETFTDKETGRKKGFAFVTFGDFDSADKCYCEFEVKTAQYHLTAEENRVEDVICSQLL